MTTTIAAFLLFVIVVVIVACLGSVTQYTDRVRRENIRKWRPAEESEMTRMARLATRAGLDETVMWWAPGLSDAPEILKDIERLREKITLVDPTNAPELFEEVERRSVLISKRAATKMRAAHPRLSALRSVYSDLVEERL